MGWASGRKVLIDYRWAAGDYALMQVLARELVELQPDVLLASSTPVVAALARRQATIPIVFVVVSDPVGSGFIESLARPGGNITGSSTSNPHWAANGLSCSRSSRRASAG